MPTISELSIRRVALVMCQLYMVVVIIADGNQRPETSDNLMSASSERALHETLATRELNRINSNSSLKPRPTSSTTTTRPVELMVRNITTISTRSPALIQSNSTTSNPLVSVRLKWRQLEQSLGLSLTRTSANLRSTLDELLAGQRVGAPQVTSGCKSALQELLTSLANQELWASQMLDASASGLPSGLLEGSLTELGNFDQCLAISHTSGGGGGGGKRSAIVSQYCTLQVKPALINRPRLHTICRRLPNLSSQNGNTSESPINKLAQNSQQFFYVGLRLGVCLPARCSQPEVQLLLTNYLTQFELTGQVKYCQLQTTMTQRNGGAHFKPDNQSTWLENQLALVNHNFILPFGQRFDSIQQCILLSLFLLLVLVALGTYLDDERNKSVKRSATLEDESTAMAQHPRRWKQYKVCSTVATNTCLSSAHLVANLQHHHHHIGQQKNPLVVGFPPSSLATTTSTSSSSSSIDSTPICSASPSTASSELLTSGVCGGRKGRAKRKSAARNCATSSQVPPPPPPPTQREQTFNCSNSLVREFLICFSLKSNLRAIAKQQQQGANSDATSMADIKAIHGLRTLSMVWVIFGHTIGLVGPEMMNNLFPLAQLACSSRLLQALLNTTLAVDTFFMISGLVTLISFARKCTSSLALLQQQQEFKKTIASLPVEQAGPEVASVVSGSSASTLLSSASSRNKNKNNDRWWPQDFKPLLWLLMRYLRLTPAYATVISLSILLPSLGSGPFWAETVGTLGPACRSNWPLNLAYLNNFLETERLCLIHSWYLSNDWQFFALTLILFATFYKSRKLTLLLVISLFLISSAITFIVTLENDFPPTIVTTSPVHAERWTFIHSLYYKPYPHLPAYLVGLITGYLLIKRQVRGTGHRDMSLASRRACWLLFSLLALAVLNSIYPWNMGLQVDPLVTGLHSATFRTLWATCCAWLVYALVTKPRNSLALFLAWHGFQITSRLTYCAYLVHPLIIYYHFGTLRERLDSSPYGQFHRFIATLGQTYLLAFALSLLIESPSIQLQRFLTRLFGPQTQALASHPPPHRGAQAAPLLGVDGAGAGSCALHQMKDRTGSESSSSSTNSAIDQEFQLKLAQAIGRGFKIRSKIASNNGLAGGHQHRNASAHPPRRLGPAKRLTPTIMQHSEQQPESLPVTSKTKATTGDNQSQELNNRWNEPLSTFVATQHAARPNQIRQQQQQQQQQHNGCCALQPPPPPVHFNHAPGQHLNAKANLDLQEMIQIKQRLISRA